MSEFKRQGTGIHAGTKKGFDPRKLNDALTPIRELTREDEDDSRTKASNASVVMARTAALKGTREKIEREVCFSLKPFNTK